jgi:hypothetical protein
MVQAVFFFILVGLWTVAGLAFVVIGIRKRDWPRSARVATIVAGVIVLLPALYELLVMAYVASCNPTASCL